MFDAVHSRILCPGDELQILSVVFGGLLFAPWPKNIFMLCDASWDSACIMPIFGHIWYWFSPWLYIWYVLKPTEYITRRRPAYIHCSDDENIDVFSICRHDFCHHMIEIELTCSNNISSSFQVCWKNNITFATMSGNLVNDLLFCYLLFSYLLIFYTLKKQYH